jgi:NitT/TauT family transport system permease protein
MPKTRLSGTAITLLWCALLLVFWSMGSAFSLPSLGELPGAWARLVTQEGLLYELGVSMRLNVEVVALSTLLSVGLAYLTVDRWFFPPALLISKFRFFGMAGFVIVFQRFFGGGHALKVAMLVFIMSTFYLTSMLDVVGSATSAEFDHAKSLRMSRWRSVWEVVVRGKLDQTFDALRQNAAIGWMSLTMVEGLVRFEGGVGVVMLNESKYRNLDAIFAVQLTVLVVGILQDLFLAWLKNVCCPHAKLEKQGTAPRGATS